MIPTSPPGEKYLNSFEFNWRQCDGPRPGGLWWMSPTDESHPDMQSNAVQSATKYFTPWIVQHHCNEWKWNAAGVYPSPHNVFVPFPTGPYYDKANNAMFYPWTEHFLRYWLDQIIDQTRFSIWNHIFETEREINRDHPKRDKRAEEAAREFVRGFKSVFV